MDENTDLDNELSYESFFFKKICKKWEEKKYTKVWRLI